MTEALREPEAVLAVLCLVLFLAGALVSRTDDDD